MKDVSRAKGETMRLQVGIDMSNAVRGSYLEFPILRRARIHSYVKGRFEMGRPANAMAQRTCAESATRGSSGSRDGAGKGSLGQ